MSSLKDLADSAKVPILTAYHALSQQGEVDEDIKKHVLSVANALNYQLRITQVDVADLAGVAKGTVSYALNGSDLIKPETQQKVLEAAQALGYKLNITARNLKTNRAGVVGYSWHIADDPSRMNNVLNRFIYRVTMAAEAQNYHLLTFIQPQEQAHLVYENLIATTRVDGFIISDVDYNDPRIERLTALNAPFTTFGGMYVRDANFAYVDVDSQYGVKLVIDHLIEQGHERIGLLTRIPGSPFGDAREAGYRTAMQNAGIPIYDDWIVYTPNILHHASSATETLMSAKHRPTAIVCSNDLMAFGAKSYLDSVNLRVPDDIALSGYDDDPTSEFLGITSVRQPIDDISVALVQILLGEINHNPLPDRQKVFFPELVIRQSTLKR